MKPPFERIDTMTDGTRSQYDQKLLEMQEKYLPLLERLVGKFSEYKKICTALKEMRPSLEWLNKLEVTCEKIQKKMTTQFFEKLDETERESRSNSTRILEKANTTSDISQAGNGLTTKKLSRWDVKPAGDVQKYENSNREKDIPNNYGNGIKKMTSVSENRHKAEKGLTVIDLTKSENVEEICSGLKTPTLQLKKVKEQDLDVEIIASTAGHNPQRRVTSQTQFVTLEEVNKSPFYKNFTSDNMILDSRAANLKYGTVYDLVKSKAQSNETRNKYHQRCDVGLSRRSTEKKESSSCRRDCENKKYHMDYFDKKTLSYNKSQVANFVNNKTYEDFQNSFNLLGQNKESNTFQTPRWSDNSYLKTKYGKTGNEFQGKIPFYKQNVGASSGCSYPEKSFTTELQKAYPPPSHPDLHHPSNKSFPSNPSMVNTQINGIGFSQQGCSFHCNCCKNTPYFSSMGASYQPTATCVVGNSNYTFFSGQFFPNHSVISPPNKNLPTPFPTYAVPPLSTPAFATSTPYSNANKPGYSVPVFCNEKSASTNQSITLWNTNNSKHPELSCRNTLENSSRPKDPRIDTVIDRLTQSTSNTTQRLGIIASSLTKPPCFSELSEERFRQSCTFLSPNNLYSNFRSHSDDSGNGSFESLKSFGLVDSLTSGNVPSKHNFLNKSIISDSNKFLKSEVSIKKNHSEIKNCNKNIHNLQSAYQKEKQEVLNLQECKTQKPQDNYISPLSNLYSDSNPKFEEYTSVTNKQLENRKRKYDEIIGRNFSSSDNKKKCIGKVKPMTKLCHIENEEYLTLKSKPNLSNTSSLKDHEKSESSKIESSPRSDVTNLSTEYWEQMTSPTECFEKEGQSKTYQTVIKEKNSVELPLKESLNSENSLVSQKENSFNKEKLMETGVSFKKLKEPKPKSHDSIANQSKSSKNTQVLEKQKLVEKDKLLKNSISSQKPDKKINDSICVQSVQLQSSEKVLVSQKEKSNQKTKTVEKISSYKIIDMDPEPNTNSIAQELLSESSIEFQKEKTIDKEKLSEQNITFSRSIIDKKKCTRTQTHQTNKSSEKELCLGESIFSNELLISKNQDSEMLSPVKEKTCSTTDNSSKIFTSITNKSKHNYKNSTTQKGKQLSKSSEKTTSIIGKNKNKCKTSKLQKSKTLKDQNKSFETPISVEIENKDNCKKAKPEKVKSSRDIDKNSINLRSSKKTSKTNNKSSENKKITHQENSVTQKKSLKNNSTLQNNNIKKHTEMKNIPHKKIANPKEKKRDKKSSSTQHDIDIIKDCSVILNKENSMIIQKCTDNKVYLEKSIVKHSDGNITNQLNKSDEKFVEKSIFKHFDGNITNQMNKSDENVQPDEEALAENTVSQIHVSSSSTCTGNIVFSERDKTEKEKNNPEEISNFNKDKVKDLVLMMKSLSKSEALKVITEFASTLKADNSQENTHLSKDQRPSSEEEEKMEERTGYIKIKDEIADDYRELLKIENNVINNISDGSETVGSTAKTIFYNSIKNDTVGSQSIRQQSLNSCEIKEKKRKLTEYSVANLNTAVTEIKNYHTSFNTFSKTSSEKLSTQKITPSNIVHKEQTEKCKFNKKKKLSELDKIHADLESCHGLDDIMKCSGLRTCRLKNEFLKESSAEDKKIKKRRVTESPEQYFFIEDEITIKMEPIPELTFDFIKEEPEYFE